MLQALATTATAVLLALSLLSVNLPSVHARSISAKAVSLCTEEELNNAIRDTTVGGTITFDCDGTIKLTSPIIIRKSLTLDGNGHTVILDGNSSVRVFFVENAQVTLNHLTIINGKSDHGSGLLNVYGAVTINNSTISNNGTSSHGGGVFNNKGLLIINNSTISFNQASSHGGGIYNAGGTLNISNSTVTDNSVSSHGGGIYSAVGALNISNSTIANNAASSYGGGIFSTRDTVTISNSTIANNKASSHGGGIFSAASTVTINNSTITNNEATDHGGGFFNDSGSITVGASIVANNVAATNVNCTGPIISQGYNLESSDDCNFSQSTDQQKIDPQFDGGLADHGGPTRTISLRIGSPAVNKIPRNDSNPAYGCPGTDQRGMPRPSTVNRSCNIGASEAQD
jgi:hypothetical protein